MSGIGYVKIYRAIQDSWLWQDKPFNYASAWVDLIMLANHNGNKFLLGTQLIEVKRGEFITSQEKLARRWGWGNTKLRSFLKLLEKQNMIVQKPTRKQTAIEIVNYSVYQTTQIENKSIPNRYQIDTKLISNTNNNEKNDNNEKNVLKKETHKEKKIASSFENFWFSYPKKQAKAEAYKSYTKINPDETLQCTILKAIELQKQSDSWLRDNGRFIPLPATWLNQKRWEDEITRVTKLHPDSWHDIDNVDLGGNE